MTAPIRVVLVDDQRMFRVALRQLLSSETDLQLVGEADNGREAIELVAQTRPHVVVMDLRMPVLDGVGATRAIVAAHPHTRVLVLTTFDDDALVFRALKEGAVGYLLKDAGADTIASAVRQAASGESVLSSAVAGKVIREFARMARLVPSADAGNDLGLSRRELDVLRHLARGATNREIAARLFVSEGTVKNHLTSIYRKLGVTDRVQALLKARTHGLT